MIAPANGHKKDETLEKLAELDRSYFEQRRLREPKNIYAAGETNRMNPTPRGVDPFGTDADYHYSTERNYFLMVERGREAVRNHPLVEQGINRLIANLRLDQITLDVDSGDEAVDADLKAEWKQWAGETAAGQNLCDYEGSRNFRQISHQSFFSQVVDGDILHLPLVDGRLQTWESHHIRTPWGHRPTGLSSEGIIHGVEVRKSKVVAYWVTPQSLTSAQRVSMSSQAKRFAAFDNDGNKTAFWLGFRHRFYQRRGISRLSPPRDAMNGFDDLNYAHTKTALRRALISYLMQQSQPAGPTNPFTPGSGAGKLPQAGDRYTSNDVGLGLQAITIEQQGEPAQVIKAPEGYTMEGWNANMPGSQFFEHASLMLTMLAVNLDIPLMFLLLDGSLVNFHGGRMTFDQAKLRFAKLQQDQIDGLHSPTYLWRIRQKLNPRSPNFDPALLAATERGVNPFNHVFRRPGWPYVKPAEDAAAEDLAEGRNLRSLRSILADRGIDLDDHVPQVIKDRGLWVRQAIREAIAIRDEFPEANIEVGSFFKELWYGPKQVDINANKQPATRENNNRTNQPASESEVAANDE